MIEHQKGSLPMRKSLAVGAVLLLGLASGLRAATATAGQLIISEFRLFGPGATNTLRDNNEFIEIYNASGSAHTVSASTGSGYGIAASDGVLRCTIPNGTVIPNHGHYLCVNSVGYTLGSYPAGNGTTATGDATYTTEIPANAGIALFNTNVPANFAVGTRLDAVGSSAEANSLYKEGTGYPTVNGTFPIDHSFTRKTVGMCVDNTCAGNTSSPAVYTSALVDTDNNATDFYFNDTNGTSAGAGQRLGTPGPENLAGPIMVDGTSQLLLQKADGCGAWQNSPNRVRDNTADAPNNSTFGTVDLRTTWRNVSGANITRLRFRIIDLTTFPSPSGVADLRPRTSTAVVVTIDGFPCGTGTSNVTIQGTTLEQPPTQANGGGFNGSLSAGTVTLGTPLANNGTVMVRFLLGIQQTGTARFCVIPETLPAVAGDPFCYIGNTESAVVPPAQQAFDFDFDQKADMPLYNPATGLWHILKSSSGFTSETVISWGGPGYQAVPGDYDWDGRLDPAVYQNSTGIWSILSSRSNFTRAYNLSFGGPSFRPVQADYDGDGVTDPAVASAAFGVWAYIASSTGLTGSTGISFGAPGFTPVGGLDFDGDGRADMTQYQERTGTWVVALSGGNYATFFTKSWGGRGYTLVPGNYDGDNQADFGVYNRATGVWSILLSTTSYASVLSKSWGGPGFLPLLADFDGDRKNEMALYQPSATKWMALKSTTSYTTVLQTTYGSSADVPMSAAVVPSSGREIQGSDFDGDAISDLTVYNTTTGVWSTLQSSSFGFTSATNHGWGGTGYTPAPGDYDGDGKADLAVYQQSTGQWLVLKSSSNFTTTYSFNAGGPGYIPVPADYDGDGRTDMAVYNTTTGLWYGLKSTGNFTTAFSIGWGGTGYTAVPGDFDADGKADIAVYQTSTGNWLILSSATNYTTSVTRNFGGAGYAPVPADFDGDGITDFAVYQTSTGVWTMLKSSTGNTAGFTVSYGGPAYTPVAGDWDGDGRADVGVYNGATGDWSILLSSGSYTTSLTKNWGGAGYVPVPAYQ
jgi:hypothetical protein